MVLRLRNGRRRRDSIVSRNRDTRREIVVREGRHVQANTGAAQTGLT
jgi:hypothetical protein